MDGHMDDPTAATADEPAAPAGPAFERELARRLTPLRHALGQLLKELGSPPTPRVLQRQLDVGYAGCWRMFRFVQASAADVTAEAEHAPSPGALKTLLAAARGRGVSDRTAAAAEAAAERLRRFIARHAENRSAFDSMLAGGIAGGAKRRSSETLVLQRRRTAYRALSHLWGVQTDLQCITALVGPSRPGDGGLNRVTLIQQRGIRRLRADARVTLSGYFDSTAAGAADDIQRVPLDPDAAADYGWPILPAFSSKPLPAVEAVTRPSGWHLYNLVGGAVGLRSNLDCTFAVTSRQPSRVLPDGRRLHPLSFTAHRKPIALLVLDLLVHRATFPGVEPTSAIYQYADGDDTPEAAAGAQRFPGEDTVAPAGPADALALAEAPAYGRLLRFAARSKGWHLAEFDAYRLRVPYPIFSSMSGIHFHTGPGVAG